MGNQVLNAKGIIELRNCHFSTPYKILVEGEKTQGMLKSRVKAFGGQNICTMPNHYQQIILLLIAKEKCILTT